MDGAADPSPEQWETTAEEQSHSGIGVWPGVIADVKPPNATLRLYGGAAFERVMHEFRCAAYSIECPPVSREKVIFLAMTLFGEYIKSHFFHFLMFCCPSNRLQIYCLPMPVEVGEED